jgi:cyclopropane-fatty-acyl-phospholipid synthase
MFATKALMIRPDKTASNGSRKWTKNLEQKLGLAPSKELNRDAIPFHYDVSNDFYALWLDEQMIYSCAYYESASQSLEQAQRNKLDLICRKLRLKPGERMLDIGCGWGALICWAAEHYGVTAHGITLSRNQYDHAQRTIKNRGLEHRVTVELIDYRDVKGEVEYDKVSSVGMFEHVGLKNLPTYFAVANRVLKPGGLFLNHGITSAEGGWKKSDTTEFINRYVFPDAQLETISTVQQVMEDSSFEIHDVENLRPHYALTLREWVKRLEQNREEALKYVPESVYRIWRFYMASCAVQFEEGNTGVYQILASKRAPFQNPVPLTRRDLYTEHAAVI